MLNDLIITFFKTTSMLVNWNKIICSFNMH
uniref:Uncharacterized protein n=1 Tax=Heterorhabditis bacteriophora TaxID=37862 RepID=A0A1I7WBK7_HETBA